MIPTLFQLWTPDAVAHRFKDAAETAWRLPPAKVQGHFNSWPQIISESWESYSADKAYRQPPDPEAIERMEVTMRWLQLLDEPDRHLILWHATSIPRNAMARHLDVSRSTLWRKWQRALNQVADKLNDQALQEMGKDSKIASQVGTNGVRWG